MKIPFDLAVKDRIEFLEIVAMGNRPAAGGMSDRHSGSS